jgi:chemotaxis protein MotB
MARLPAWAEEPDQNAFAGRAPSGGGSTFKRVLVGFAVVGVATFVAAYYLPLYRAHQSLTVEQRTLSQKVETLESTLSTSKRELESVSREKSELSAEREKRDGVTKAGEEKLATLKKDISVKLEKAIAKGGVSLTVAGESVIVGVTDGLVFTPNKSDVSPKGKLLLCDVAKAASGRSIALSGVSAEAPATFDSIWGYTAARAASAAATLESKCGVSAQKLSATGRGAQSSPEANREFGKLPSRLEISLTP